MKTQKGQAPFLVLIGVLIITAVASGAYYLGRSQTITPQPTPTPDASREPNGSAETANWKTYTDGRVGFSIKYPENYLVTPLVVRPKDVFEFELTSDDYNYEYCLRRGAYISVFVNNFSLNKNEDSLNQMIGFERQYTLAPYKGVENPPVQVDGQKAAKFVYKGYSSMGGCLAEGTTLERFYTLNRKGIPYEIEVSYFTKEKDRIKILHQILSTFKFIQ